MIKASTIFHCGIYHYHSFIVYNTSVLFGPILGAVHMYSAVYKCVYIHYHHHHYDLDHHHHPTLHHHLPASSRGQAHFWKSTKNNCSVAAVCLASTGVQALGGAGRCSCVHRHTAAPPSFQQRPGTLFEINKSCARPLLETRHWEVLLCTQTHCSTSQPPPVSSRGQLHPAWKLTTFNLKHRWLSVRTPHFFLMHPLTTPIPSRETLVWSIFVGCILRNNSHKFVVWSVHG